MMFRIKSVERIGWSNILKFMSIHAFHSGSNFQKVSYLKLLPASMAAKVFFGKDWGYTHTSNGEISIALTSLFKSPHVVTTLYQLFAFNIKLI